MKTNPIKRLLWLAIYSLPVIAFAANLTEPRAAVVPPARMHSSDLPFRVIVNKRQLANPARLSRTPFVSLKLQGDRPSAQEVRAFVQNQAREHGVNPLLALWIVKHESQFNPRAKGDGEASRGLWQISKIYHPEVSDRVAFNVASSTEWSLERIRAGKVNEWSTYRFCRELYRDCPF
jgi:hypothetical protein